MSLRPLIAVLTLFAAPVALAAGQPGSETTGASTTNAPPRTTQPQRKVERLRPAPPLAPRVIEAPGAAVMMIPASFEPASGPFSAF